MKAIYERKGVNYVTYDNPDTANIVHENFYLEKRLFGIRIFRKVWRQDSNIWEQRHLKTTGFKR
jgi:hypothetical protein